MQEQIESTAGALWVIGLGPGSLELLTPLARQRIEDADLVVGYSTYLALIEPLLAGKERFESRMTQELERAQSAVDAALAGRKVVLVSSGDAGMYGMASLALELLEQAEWTPARCAFQVIPGITAANACAALVGAPLGHDSCTISLSDLMTPWPLIERRIELAAEADFCISFYNPVSKRRTWQIEKAREILLAHRAADTPVAIVKSGWRERQSVSLCTLGTLLKQEIGMLGIVIVGNSQSRRFGDLILTPRGYSAKYQLHNQQPKAGQKPGHSLALENTP